MILVRTTGGTTSVSSAERFVKRIGSTDTTERVPPKVSTSLQRSASHQQKGRGSSTEATLSGTSRHGLFCGVFVEEGLHPLIQILVEGLRKLFETTGSRLRSLILLFLQSAFLVLDALLEGCLEIDEVLNEFLGGARAVDAFDDRFLKWLVLGEMEKSS